jgi:hypothetical protein
MKYNFRKEKPGCGFWLGVVLLTLLFLALYLILIGGLITLAWNAAIVGAFNAKVISWTEGTAFAGLLFLIGLVLRSMRTK